PSSLPPVYLMNFNVLIMCACVIYSLPVLPAKIAISGPTETRLWETITITCTTRPVSLLITRNVYLRYSPVQPTNTPLAATNVHVENKYDVAQLSLTLFLFLSISLSVALSLSLLPHSIIF